MPRKAAKSHKRGRKLHSTVAKARGGRARKIRADLERQLKACRQETARARERLAEATMQQTATSEMLRLISNSPIQSVLDAVAEHAARLCDASNAEIFRLEHNLLRLVASYGEIPVIINARDGIPLSRDTVIGRATCDHRTIHVHNLAEEGNQYPVGSRNAKREGHRTTLATPLLRGGNPVGVILIRRWEVRSFSDKQISLLETFADQAAIAIENVRLFEAEKQSQAQLAKAQRELRQLIDTIRTPVASYSADNRRDFVNAAWKQYTGLSDEAALGTEWSVVTHPDHIAAGEKMWRDALGTGEPWHTEERVRRADGQYRWFAINRVAARDENGEIIKWYATGYDIEDRKRAEERLRVQHTVALILAEAATIEEATPRILLAIGECLGWDLGVLWRVDREAEALRCVELWHEASIEVPEFERVSREFTFGPGLGLPGRVWSSLEPEYIPDVVPDENFPRASTAEREGLRGAFGFPILLGGEALGVIEFFSREIRHPDQELLNVLATIGSQIGQFIERKRAEHSLRESEGKLRDYAETASDWFWEIGPDYKYTLLTENAFGSHSADRIGTACWDHADDLLTEPEKWRLIRATLDARQPFRDFICRELSGNGSPMYVRASGRPVFDAKGEFRGYRGTGTDVTALMRAQEEQERLRQLESELAHMNRLIMMGELAASLAHEIAQPIATARNNARAATHFLDHSPPDLGQVREAVDCVVDDADRAGEILDRIRAQIKKAPPRKESVDFNQAINDVVALAQGAIVKNEILVQTRLAEGLPHVQADRVQMQQVVLNLVLNAVEAMGSIDEGVRELSITTKLQEAGGVLVAVGDSGAGILPEQLNRVFDAFYTTKSSGVGIGLSICRSIIDAHGGRLWASANEPRGAIFRFTLPSAGEGS